MNAQEARRRATTVLEGKNKEQYDEIMDEIEIAVYEGKFYINYYAKILAGVDLKLREEGYEINSHHDQQDGTTNTIKW